MNWTPKAAEGKDYHTIWIPTAEGIQLPARPVAKTPLEAFYYSDAHGAFFSGKLDSFPQRLAAKRRQARGDTLLLAGGDDHGGGSIWDAFITEQSPQSVGFDLMRHSGVDGFVIGNHDLDWGCQRTIDCLESQELTLLLSTLQADCPLAAVSQPALVYQFNDKSIGLLGVPNTKDVMGGSELFDDPYTRLPPLIEAMSPHVNALIVISHLGSTDDPLSDDRALQSILPPHALLCGSHSHQTIPSPDEGSTPSRYLQSGSQCETYGHAQWDSRSNWRVSNHPSETLPKALGSASLQHWSSAKNRLLKAKGKVAFTHSSFREEEHPIDSYRSENPRMNWACDQLATLADKRCLIPTIAMLCARSLGSACFGPDMDLQSWYQSFHYGDRIVKLRIKAEHAEALVRSNAKRVQLAPSYIEEEGFLHFDASVRQAITSNALSSQVTSLQIPGDSAHIQVLTQAYVASGAGGYRDKFKALGIKLCAVETLNLSLRDHLWERARLLSPLSSNPLDGRLKINYTDDKAPSWS